MNINTKLIGYCEHKILPNIKLYSDKKVKKKRVFWPPSVAIAAYYDNYIRDIEYSYSHVPGNGEIKDPLYSVYKSLLNNKPCKNGICHCAEQHVAILLSHYVCKRHITWDRAKIQFSKAIRPRTMQFINYCDNCKLIFRQL